MDKKAQKVLLFAAVGYGLYRCIQFLYSYMNGEKEEKKDSLPPKEINDDSPLDDASVTIQSILEEDPLYNNFSFYQLKSMSTDTYEYIYRFNEFYRRAHVNESIKKKVMDANDFALVLEGAGIVCPELTSNLLNVWDNDHDGFVSIHDFIHTIAYSTMGSERQRMEYIFDSVDMDRNDVISYNELFKSIYYLKKIDPDVDLEDIDHLSTEETNLIFEEMKENIARGISKNDFLEKGKFLQREISLMKPFAMALLQGDAPPTK